MLDFFKYYFKEYFVVQILVIIFLLILLILFCRCDYVEPIEQNETEYESVVEGPDSHESAAESPDSHEGARCGDGVCDYEEDYWSCLDCVDLLTGNPKTNYCGDHVCFGTETWYNCWSDCGFVPYNKNPEIGPGPGGPNPGPY